MLTYIINLMGVVISHTQHHVSLKTFMGGLKVSQSPQKQPENK
jgi:hypothetical protein